jgi:hypothetical protein
MRRGDASAGGHSKKCRRFEAKSQVRMCGFGPERETKTGARAPGETLVKVMVPLWSL